MPDKEVARSIRFPLELWKQIDADADVHKRSAVKHLEFLLSAYYNEQSPALNFEKMSQIKHGPPPEPELTYKDFRKQIDALGLDHLEFIEDLRGAPSERLVEVLDAVKLAVNKTLEDLTYDKSHHDSADALRQ